MKKATVHQIRFEQGQRAAEARDRLEASACLVVADPSPENLAALADALARVRRARDARAAPLARTPDGWAELDGCPRDGAAG